VNVAEPRIGRVRGPESYSLPARPPESAGAAALDAYRQTRFLLGNDLDLFADLAELQLALLRDANPAQSSRYRTPELAAMTALWSRSYQYLTDALLLATRGSYASAVPLVRAAAESIAAEEGLRAGEMPLFQQWLGATLRPDEKFKALEFELGRYFAGEVLAADDVLRSVYRPAAELSRPAFGASLLQVGPESNNNRLAIAFADTSFHLGWAEVMLGWLLALADKQVEVVLRAGDIFPVSEGRQAAFDALHRRVSESLDRSDRCRIQEVPDGNDLRYLVHNFRRASGAAPKRVLL
jgi:hypothetical protein